MFSESLSVVLPAYNDEPIIATTIETTLEKCGALFNDFELILIDDASGDGTREIIRHYGEKYPRHITTIYHPSNLGVGSGIRNGFAKAKNDYVITNFSDLPFDFSDLATIFASVLQQNADGCIVVRKDRSANSPFRKLTSIVNYMIIRCLFNLPIRDYQFVQLYRRTVLDNIEIQAKDVFVPAEIMIKLHDMGFRLIQEEATFHPREGGSANYGKMKYFIATFQDQIKFFFRLRLGKRYGS